ncbi:hypothetical protein HU200_060455 [Digitaria exilis]|uniref:Uncharacterized protein n=1 Tax=Digitaria exilis TaxID=1010633 RepID=A0A835A6F1_9POAL|nr:hypothetical protein HU200_060455 [Digitaria exilis]
MLKHDKNKPTAYATMQLYFYDTDESMPYRSKRSPHLDANLIRNVVNILENNPYVDTFRSLGQVPNLDEYKIELISVDRRFNAPLTEQVAVIWQDGTCNERRFTQIIVIYANSGQAHFIRANHGCYDPLPYPLFYPRGETGWE